MKTITIDDIRSWRPCYDPCTGMSKLPEDWTGTVFDILDLDIPINDSLWVVLRNDFLTDCELRLFAVWCARQVQHLMKDERSLRALDVSEAYAKGEATNEELIKARYAARAAASDAVRYAASAAARDAAWAAASAAARDAARYAARYAASATAIDAARAAASDAVRYAAWDAASDAASAAAWAARCAAWEAAHGEMEKKQLEKIREIFKNAGTSLHGHFGE